MVKEAGTGKTLHTKSIGLTVLLKPSPPRIFPAAPVAIEGVTQKTFRHGKYFLTQINDCRQAHQPDVLQWWRVSSPPDQVVQGGRVPAPRVHHDPRGHQGRAEQQRPHHPPQQEHGRRRLQVHRLEQSPRSEAEAGDQDQSQSQL